MICLFIALQIDRPGKYSSVASAAACIALWHPSTRRRATRMHLLVLDVRNRYTPSVEDVPGVDAIYIFNKHIQYRTVEYSTHTHTTKLAS